MKRILHIERAEVCGSHLLDLVFSDGVKKRVNVRPLLEGEIFRSLHDPAYFGRVELDPVAKTVVWPNGADFAPEALYELPDEGGCTPPAPAGNTPAGKVR